MSKILNLFCNCVELASAIRKRGEYVTLFIISDGLWVLARSVRSRIPSLDSYSKRRKHFYFTVRKLEAFETKLYAHGHKATKWLNQKSNPDLSNFTSLVRAYASRKGELQFPSTLGHVIWHLWTPDLTGKLFPAAKSGST